MGLRYAFRDPLAVLIPKAGVRGFDGEGRRGRIDVEVVQEPFLARTEVEKDPPDQPLSERRGSPVTAVAASVSR